MTEFGRISDDVNRSDCIFFEFQRCRRILDISLARDKAWKPIDTNDSQQRRTTRLKGCCESLKNIQCRVAAMNRLSDHWALSTAI